jgi:hypothetical protein
MARVGVPSAVMPGVFVTPKVTFFARGRRLANFFDDSWGNSFMKRC